jgi:ribosomal protein S12 methylthiotransferase accessory factor
MADEELEITFAGGKRIDARVGRFVIHTDQPAELGGEGSAVAPFELFLASLGTCAGLYVLGFCRSRGLSTEGLSLKMQVENDEDRHLPRRIRIELALPPSFPEKYRTSVLRAAEACKVKKTIAAQPAIEVVALQRTEDSL